MKLEQINTAPRSPVLDALRPCVDVALSHHPRIGQHPDRVFLIRAAGRTGEQMLASLHKRLQNTAATEDRTVAKQLREIAILRLEGVVTE